MFFFQFLVNVGMAVSGTAGQMAVLWAVNGLLQSLVWTPMIKSVADLTQDAQCARTCLNLSTTTPAGTLGAYLMCVLCVASPWGWRLSFWLGGAALAAGGAVWIFGMRALERISEKSGIPDMSGQPEDAAPERAPGPWRVLVCLLPVVAASVMYGLLRDGIITWAPSYLQESFGFPAATSIALTMIVPPVNLGGVYAFNWLRNRLRWSEAATAAAAFAICGAGIALWTAAGRGSVAVTILMLKMECRVIDRNPDFKMQGRDFLRRIDWEKGTVTVGGKEYPLRDTSFPTVDPAGPAKLNPDEQVVLDKLVQSFRQSEKLQQHIEFLYAKGSVYHIENGNLLYHGVVPMTKNGSFAVERFEGHSYSGRALMDYCDERARRGYFAPEGSAARQSGQDFLWYLWCGKLSPLFGRSAMTTFERIYIADPATYEEIKDPYYTWYNEEAACRRILAEFGLPGTNHIVNGHVPVREKSGESPIKGGGRLVVIDGGFCRAYHDKTGIAGYTLVYSSRTMSLRTHQPFESAEKAVNENIDIISQKNILETENHRILVEETDEGEALRERVHDLKQLVKAYQLGWIKETHCEDCVW